MLILYLKINIFDICNSFENKHYMLAIVADNNDSNPHNITNSYGIITPDNIINGIAQYNTINTLSAKDIMTKNIISVSSNTTLLEAINYFASMLSVNIYQFLIY